MRPIVDLSGAAWSLNFFWTPFYKLFEVDSWIFLVVIVDRSLLPFHETHLRFAHGKFAKSACLSQRWQRAELSRARAARILARARGLMLGSQPRAGPSALLGSAREIQSFACTCLARLEMLVACGLVAYKTFLRTLVCAFCMLHAESLFLWGERFMVQMRRIGPILICLFEKASLGLI
jgi:hypothetical protein